MNITYKTLDFEQSFDGYIGLQPYQAKPDLMDLNFMRQLQQQGLIDHQVVMLNKGDASSFEAGVIKFGGWDKSAI